MWPVDVACGSFLIARGPSSMSKPVPCLSWDSEKLERGAGGECAPPPTLNLASQNRDGELWWKASQSSPLPSVNGTREDWS